MVAFPRNPPSIEFRGVRPRRAAGQRRSGHARRSVSASAPRVAADRHRRGPRAAEREVPAVPGGAEGRREVGGCLVPHGDAHPEPDRGHLRSRRAA